MKWITREKARVDRIACPWLIARFIDKEPTFLFVPASEGGRRGTLASPLAYSRRWAGSVAAWWAEGAPTILIRRLLPAHA
jgi:hypothetical protein